jgi:glucose/mannose transport system substrate-binding protein
MNSKSRLFAVLNVILMLSMVLTSCVAPTAIPEPTKAPAAPAVAAPTAAPAAPVAPTVAPAPAPTAAPAPAPTVAPAAAAAKGKLEIFSWWTTGGEAAGLDAIYKLYAAKFPNVEVVNATVAGGAGSNAKAVLKTRMLGGDPPDSFQVHMGHELIDTWVTTDFMQPLDDLFKSEGLTTAFPKGVLDIVSSNGHPWSVPVNIHRSNVLWYNKTVFSKNGIAAAPKTFEEFFATADKLKAAGITPLAMGDNGPWAAAQVFEDVLAGTLGPDGYNALWTGKITWSDPQVLKALDNFKKMLTYVNTDHAALSWDQANDLVISGKAAMTIMGDWIDGDYVAKKFTDYGWAPTPGTDGMFVALSDTFGLPKKIKNQANALEFLKLLGSKAGQEAFNPKKGSICARTDCDPKLFDAYLQSAMKDWNSNVVLPSLAHGAAAKEGWVTEFVDAISVFVTKGEVTVTAAALNTACKNAGGTCADAIPAYKAPTAGAVPAGAALPAGLKGKLEIFSWWTTGGEAAGLNAIYEMFKKTNPGVEVVNATVAGGAGSNAKAVLKTRMLGGDPPDSFQVHMGHELIDTWVTSDFMQPLDEFYKTFGLNDAFPKGVLDIVSANGKPWSVPVNIHRANVLWYNKTVFAKNGIAAAPKTFDEFFATADKLKAAGVTPLALGDNGIWASSQLFETVLAGTLGAEGYKGLWTGKTDWKGPEVQKALETFKKMLSYANTDHAALSWDQANDLVISGKAAMTVMGDWIDGDYVAKKFTDYGWAPTPGTTGIFDALSDTFGLPKGAKNKDNALALLAYLGSKAGQEAFNPLKGSICARTDCDPKLFDAYLQSAMQDWSSAAIVPSLAHGAAASEGWVTEFNDAMGVFVTKQDVTATQATLAAACKNAGVCK